MTRCFDFPFDADSQAFDRLVDGELSAIEERALLRTLDTRPDGWRQCALAFLEARAWKNDLAPLTSAEPRQLNGTRLEMPLCATGSASASTVKQTAPANIASKAQWPRLLAVAASVTLAFFLGIAAQRNWPSENTAPRGKLARGVDDATVREQNRAFHDDQRVENGRFHSAADAASSLTMTLVDSRGDATRQFEVPLIESDRLDPSWLASRPSAMPEDEVEELRRLGYRVDQQRFYVPVVLDDGRSAIVPLDRANIRYAGMQF